MPPKSNLTSALAACRASAILHQASSISSEVETLQREVAALNEELPLLREENDRLRSAVSSTETELTIVTRDIEQLLQSREQRRLAPPDPEVYTAVAKASEENNNIQLSLESRKLALEQLLVALRETTEVLRQEELRLSYANTALESLDGSSWQEPSDGANDCLSELDLQELRYLCSLEAMTRRQAVDLQRLQDAALSKEQSEEQIRENEKKIVKARSELEACGLDVPVAPMTARLARVTRQRERLAGVAPAGGLSSQAAGDPLHLGTLQDGNLSLLRMTTQRTTQPVSAPNNGGTIEQRRYLVPAGHLSALVNVLGPLRSIASAYSLESCTAAVGQDPREDDISLSSHHRPSSSQATCAKTTVLVCRGLALYLHRFESVLVTALTEAAQLVSRVDGTLTYQSLYGGASQQQREMAQKLAAATGATSHRSAAATASPPPALVVTSNPLTEALTIEDGPRSTISNDRRRARVGSAMDEPRNSAVEQTSPVPRTKLSLEEPMSILKGDAASSRPRSLSWNNTA